MIMYSSNLTIFLLCRESAEFLLGKLVSHRFSVTPGFQTGESILMDEDNIACALHVYLTFDKGFKESLNVIRNIISIYDISYLGFHYTSVSDGCVFNSNIKRSIKPIKSDEESDSNISNINLTDPK